MIAKKNKKVDLERKRFAFFQIGLIVSGSLCLAAFEFSTAEIDAPKAQRLSEPSSQILEVEPVFENVYQQPKTEKRSSVIRLDETLTVTDKKVIEGEKITFTDEKITIDPRDGETGGSSVGWVPVEEPILPTAEIEPSFPGGLQAMAEYINDNINLPEISSFDEGIVYVQFVVNEDGSIEQANVVQGVSREVDRAALRVVQGMPNWSPGKQAGKEVRVRFTLPISIRLY